MILILTDVDGTPIRNYDGVIVVSGPWEGREGVAFGYDEHDPELVVFRIISPDNRGEFSSERADNLKVVRE